MWAALTNWRLLAALGAVAALCWWRYDGVLQERARRAAEDAKALQAKREAVADHVLTSSAITAAAVERLLLERSRIALQNATLKGQTRDYVPPSADRRCVVGDGFVLHHNAAWAGTELPKTAGQLVERDSGVLLSQVADTTADNAAICRGFRAEVIAWREWYGKQAEAWETYRRRAAGESVEVSQPKKGR